MIDSIDPAFLDRIDMQVYLAPPSVKARYQILHSCIVELMRKGIISSGINLSLCCLYLILISYLLLGHEIKDYNDDLKDEFLQHHGDREKGSKAIDLSAIFSDGYSDIFTANHHLYLISLLSEV
jgi:SpoVK/Ycf46/Vps4 family AAA+-type ATPase